MVIKELKFTFPYCFLLESYEVGPKVLIYYWGKLWEQRNLKDNKMLLKQSFCRTVAIYGHFQLINYENALFDDEIYHPLGISTTFTQILKRKFKYPF